MKRRTILQTEVIVEEQQIRPRKCEIRKRIKLERNIAAAVNLTAMIVSTAVFVKITFAVWETLTSRMGTVGGEILVFPAIIMAFAYGYERGVKSEKKQQEMYETEENTEF